MRNAVLIANPKAGQGGPARRMEAIERFCELLRARQVHVEVRPTLGPNDATRLAAEAVRDGFREIVVSGGDGTINEALQGMIGSAARLGIWPRGTANVLGRELHLPRQVERIAKIIGDGKVRRIHTGCVTIEKTRERRYFLLMAGVGIDAAIANCVRPTLKKRVGEAAYWYSGLEHFARWKLVPFTVQVSGAEYSATFAVIGKAPHYGGRLALTPRARMDLPEFEICLIHSKRRLHYLRCLSFAILGGMPEGMKDVTFLHATAARAVGDGVQVQIDGEVIGELPMTFEISPYSVEVITERN